MSHPMMADANHDERASQLFTRDLKAYIAGALDPAERRLTEAVADSLGSRSAAFDQVEKVRDELFAYDTFRSWLSLKRTSQEMLWNAVGECVDRQIDALNARAAEVQPKGSLRLDPAFEAPPYLTGQDIHLMPGGYTADEGDVRQGALMDRGGAVFMMGRNGGRNGGLMNDARGGAVVAHLLERYPDLQPKRILELGCGVGVSATAVARHFPDAELHAVDVGASMLRYAHARAEHLGLGIHFSQQDAEHTDFPDASFDLVYTCVVFHESSASAIRNIVREARRLLRPGGVMVNLEVSIRYPELDLFQKIEGEFETHYNNEPCWREAMSLDYEAVYREAGFNDITVGYQAGTSTPEPGQTGFSAQRSRPFGLWYVGSARN